MRPLFSNLNLDVFQIIITAGAVIGLAIVIVLLFKQKKRIDLSKYRKNMWFILKK